MSSRTIVIVLVTLIVLVVAGRFLLGGSPRGAAADLVPAGTEARGSETGIAEPRTSARDAPPLEREGDGTSLSISARTHVLARVVDESGRPLPGVRMLVRVGDEDFESRSLVDGEVEVAMDLDGSERLDDGRVWAECELSHRERETLHRGARLVVGGTTYLGRLTLAAGAAVTGTVVDQDGLPFPGARVFVQTVPDGTLPFRPPHDVERQVGSQLPYLLPSSTPGTTTSGDGTYTVTGLHPGRIRVWVSSPLVLGAFSDPIELVAGQVVPCGPLTLAPSAPEAVVEGVLLSPDGAPVEGARVVMGSIQVLNWAGARSDAEGRFRYTIPRDRAVDLVADDPLGRWCPTDLLGVRAGTQGLRVPLARCPDLTLRASTPTDEPIERFAVVVQAADQPRILAEYPLAVHPRGLVSIPPPSSPFRLKVSAPGFEPAFQGEFPRLEEDTVLEFRLAPVPAITGTVLADGAPVADARIECWGLLEDMRWKQVSRIVAEPALWTRVRSSSPQRSLSDGPGHFTLDRPGDGDHLLRVEAPGFAPYLEWSPGGFDEPVVVRLERGGAIQGRVLVPPDEDPSGIVIAATCGDGYLAMDRTGDDGGFSLNLLAPGRYQLARLEDEPREPRGPGLEREREDEPVARAEVRSGEVTTVELDLRGEDRPMLSGSVAIGSWSFADWLASVTPIGERDPAVPPMYVSPEGAFQCRLPRSGRYRLVLSGRDPLGNWAHLTEDVSIEGEEVQWRARLHTGRLEGEVHLDVAQLWPDKELACVYQGPGTLRVFSRLAFDDQHRLRPVEVPEGVLEVVRLKVFPRVDLDSASPALADLKVVPGTTNTVSLQ